MKLPTFILKIFRRMISFLVRFLPTGKITDFLVWPLSKRLFGYGYSEIVNIDTNLKMRLYGDMNDMVNKSLLFMSGYKNLAWEPVTARLVKQLAPQIKTVVVAGSHLGYYPLIISANNPNSKIYAFEPNPTNYKRFVDNIYINNFLNIKANQIALGEKEGEEKMFFDSGQSSFFESEREHSGEGLVKITTMDKFFNSLSQKPDLLVLDAEGYEPNILKGAQLIVEESKPDIIFEVNPNTLKAGGSHQNELCNMLMSRGYKLFMIEDDYRHYLNDVADPVIVLKEFSVFLLDNMPFVNLFATMNEEKVKLYLK